MKLEPIVNQPLIETAKFDLRALRTSDAGFIDLHASDERVARNTMSVPHPLPPGTTQAMIARSAAEDRDTDYWAIDATKLDGAQIMGLVWLERLGRNQSNLGGWVAPPFWNLGVASAVVEAVLRHNPQSSTTFFASVFQDNPASARVLTNVGFQYLGDAEAYCVARAAQVPIWTYSRRIE
ncbi:MAG: GNAT family N-acetyltransferase [Roseovarius sp.]